MAMQRRYRKKLPTIWLMTDERIGESALLAAIDRLPKGRAGVIFRHYRTAAAERRALFDRVARMARRRRLVLMLGGTAAQARRSITRRSEEHTSELQSLMRISYAVFCLKKKKKTKTEKQTATNCTLRDKQSSTKRHNHDTR